jgi:hypothetical protein
MKTFFVMSYLFVIPALIIPAIFMSLGLPLNDNVVIAMAWCAAFIGFERICSLLGLVK